MQRLVVSIALALVFALGGGVESQQSSESPPRFGFSVEFEKVAGEPASYVCVVEVLDLDSGAVIAAPRIAAEVGHPATVMFRPPGAPVVLHFGVWLDPEGRKAKFESSWSSGTTRNPAPMHRMVLSLPAASAP